jgi:hypothetical protein
MGIFKKDPPKKEEPKKEPARVPGRTSTHRHSYDTLVSDITNVGGVGGAGRAVTRSCSCGKTQTTNS